jgi:predicted nucleotidyltransferase
VSIMEGKLFHITEAERETISARIVAFLEKRPDILFVYLHGSFVASDMFRDIDVAVFLAKVPLSPLEYELSLEMELGDTLRKYPVDVRVLNNAPLSFRYNVIRHGKAVTVAHDDARCDFEETTLSNYFDFAPFRKTYLKEVLGLGI